MNIMHRHMCLYTAMHVSIRHVNLPEMNILMSLNAHGSD